MNRWRLTFFGFCAFCLVLAGIWLFASKLGVNPPLPKALTNTSQPVSYLQAPEGFNVSLFADGLDAPRMMRQVAAGLMVSLPHEGKVLLLQDLNQDGQAEARRVVLDGLNKPHGLDVADGWLYVAETDAVGRVPFDAAEGVVTGDYQRILLGLPSGKGHWTRTVKMGPDGWLYVSVGSSCNVCIEEAPERAAMLRMRPDGTEKALYATGLRNSVDFDWSPGNGGLYATDNGRDWLGDDFPPDELNRIEAGGFYGWPFANGNKIPDPDLGEGQQTLIDQSITPTFEFRAHNAPLGIGFLKHQNSQYQHAALVALHGSWNRSTKDGYKVIALHWAENGEIEAHDFLTGFLEGETVYGRPVGIAESTDGTIYISDDYAGVIYRVSQEK